MISNKKMQKFGMRSLVAAMIVGGVFSAPAWALDLSVYGVGHMSVDNIDTGAQTSTYIHSNSSRLGFRGDQDLSNGLTAFFQFESGVDLTGNGGDDGNGGLISQNQSGPMGGIFTEARDSYVGVKGDFGSVEMGRLPGLNQWVYDYNLFADQVGDLGNVWDVDGLPGRVNGAALYRTPDFNGFTLGLSYVPSQNTAFNNYTGGFTSDALSNIGNSYIAKADYVNGGLKLGGAYADFGGAGIAPDNVVGAITGSYDFGAFNVGGGWQQETGVSGGIPGISGDRNSYTLGAAAKAGSNGTVKIQYAGSGNVSGTSNTSGQQWAAGYDYAWDKNTILYVAYAQTNNGSATASFNAYGFGHGNYGVPTSGTGFTPLGGDTSVISVGFIYKFDANLLHKSLSTSNIHDD
uniref:Porin, Gram-negative type n=1 Tax=mine drainage metagenome TaxID=410659 RepID=E6QQ82_9ZZZZ